MTATSSHIKQNRADLLLCVEENERYRLALKTDKWKLVCSAAIERLPVLEDAAAENHDDRETTVAPAAENTSDNRAEPLLAAHEVIRLLQRHNIVQAIDYAAVYDFCAQIDLGLDPEPTVLARGVPPQPGEDGRFELIVKVFGDEIELQEDESGRVDHKDLHAYTEIEVGQKLGLVHSPKAGMPGMTVAGGPIPAEPGQPFELIAGEGVELKYDRRVAFATKAGRAVLEKQVLSVVDLLSVPGDVDLTIGDINFNGLVEIKGEVPDDFDVKAGKGLKLHGPVGACQIESGGPIEMTSMAGKEIGSIVCRGDLRATFLNQVSVFCYGDVIVTNEIRNCRIKSTGRITVERGAIIGGKCIALAGIEAQDIGTPSGQRTVLLSGRYFPDEDRFTYLHQRTTQIDGQIKAISEAIGPLKRLIGNAPDIAPAAERRLVILQEQLDKLKAEKMHTQAEIKASAPQNPAGRNPKINIHKHLLEGVEINLGETWEKVTIERRGPLSVIENSEEGGLRYLPLSPLSLEAKALEEQLLAEEE